MRMRTFAVRNMKEILRDPLTVGFSLGFPVVLLLLMTLIQRHIPVEMFALPHLTPGVTVFGLSFLTLFSATLIAKDRESALLQRLFAAPMTAWDFLFGYTLPLLPIALGQCAICYLIAVLLGMPVTVTIVYAALWVLPVSLLFIALGLLCGSVLNTKQVGGICGALLTNLTAWLSGIWFDIDLLGKGFRAFANGLPFLHAVELERAVLAGTSAGVGLHAAVILAYAAVLLVLAAVLFVRKMKS